MIVMLINEIDMEFRPPMEYETKNGRWIEPEPESPEDRARREASGIHAAMLYMGTMKPEGTMCLRMQSRWFQKENPEDNQDAMQSLFKATRTIMRMLHGVDHTKQGLASKDREG